MPSEEVPATSIPPKKQGKGFAGGPPIDCSQEQLWDIYMSIPGNQPIPTAVHKILLDKGIKCSLQWVKWRIHGWDFPRKRAFALAATSHPVEFDEAKIRVYLEKMGRSFNPAETIGGVQLRILAIISSKMVNESPQVLQEFMKLYAMMTDELKRNYQKRLEDGDIINLPKAKTDDPSTVTPFKKREGAKP